MRAVAVFWKISKKRHAWIIGTNGYNFNLKAGNVLPMSQEYNIWILYFYPKSCMVILTSLLMIIFVQGKSNKQRSLHKKSSSRCLSKSTTKRSLFFKTEYVVNKLLNSIHFANTVGAKNRLVKIIQLLELPWKLYSNLENVITAISKRSNAKNFVSFLPSSQC